MSENRKLLEMNVPMWFDGKSINEALFCEDFLRTRQILFANGAFFTPDGRVTDDLPLRGEIFEELKYCAVNNIPRKISNIIEIMKLATHVEDFPPEKDRIHLANGSPPEYKWVLRRFAVYVRTGGMEGLVFWYVRTQRTSVNYSCIKPS